jgi:NAD(P)-dependent dehydrogenase (short-subunit alcohol dehydrogenase family)
VNRESCIAAGATPLVEAGAGVVLCDLNAEALDTVAPGLGDYAVGRVTDVSDESQVDGAMRAARDAFGSLDIIVNCAGFGVIAPLTEVTAEKWRSVQAVTLGGVFFGVKQGARHMLEQGRPRRRHQHLLGERTAAGRGAGRLLCGEGRRGHDHTLRLP